MTPNTIDFDQVRVGFENMEPGSVLILVTVLLVFLLYSIAVIFARRADKRDLEKVRLPKTSLKIYVTHGFIRLISLKCQKSSRPYL